jgi:hypothetical protein
MRPLFPLLTAFAFGIELLANPAPVPGTQPLGPVFEAADLVCDCVVVSTKTIDEEWVQATVGNPILRRHMTAIVEVEDIYRSSARSTKDIAVGYDGDMLRAGERGVFFLKSAKAGYIFADQFLGVTACGSLAPRPESLGLLKLQLALVDVLSGSTREDQINAMRLLQGFDVLEERSLSSVAALTTSADPETALTALAVLLKGRVPGSVERLKTYLDGYQGAATPIALLSIGSDLGQVNNTSALRAVEALASSRYLSIRFGAMNALRRLRDPLSIPVLIERLSDSDDNIRYLAVITLAEISGKTGDYAPSMYLFDKNPSFYVNLWKEWTKSGQSQ